MTEPRWLETLMILAIHAGQVREHGGARGLRDEALLESALAPRRHRCGHDEGIDLIGLAAAYGFDLARDSPFIDGNKRVAFQAMYVFLGLIDRFLPALDGADEAFVAPSSAPIAHPILARAELLALGSDRLREVAYRLRDQLILPRLVGGA